jgi:hypothetical protein
MPTRKTRSVPLVSLLSATLLIVACGLPPSSAHAAGLDLEAPRGARVARFPIAGQSGSEACFVPKHLSFGKYNKKDEKHEQELCHANFDEVNGATDATGAVALCPKTNSTSAAVVVFKVPDTHPKAELETASACLALESKSKPEPALKKDVKQLGKFKQTDDERTCTSTPSILAYYHVSRALGGLGLVAPSVIRTMDFAHHAKLVSLALSIPRVQSNSALKTSWSNFRKYSAGASSNPSAVFTSDNRQIYGAFVRHSSADRYDDWITNHDSDATRLEDLAAYKRLTNPAAISSQVGSRDFKAENVQKVVATRDVGEMILIDTLMQQNDRLSGNNIDSSDEFFYREGAAVKSVGDVDGLPAGTPPMRIKRVHLSDNDCGLIEGPGAMVKGGYLARIAHMHPQTYARLMQLADRWEKDPEVQAFFRTETLFSEKTLASFGAGLLKARDTLKARCKASEHFLDLDLDDYVNGTEPDRSRCDAIAPA